MARNAAYRWQNERKKGLLSKEKRRKRPQRGITNKQAKYLARLQRELREPYTGDGMAMAEASRAIDDCKRRLNAGHERLDRGLDEALRRDAA